MKIYQEIKGVSMANDNFIESVWFYDMPTIDDMRHEDSFGHGLEMDDLPTSKNQVMDWASHKTGCGYGKHSGRKIWQLPPSIRKQIKKTLIKKEVTK